MAIASAMVSAEAAEAERASPARETAAIQRLRRRMIISNPQKPDAPIDAYMTGVSSGGQWT